MKKKKLNINKKNWTWGLLALAMVMVWAFAIQYKKASEVDGLKIEILAAENSKSLITKKDVHAMLSNELGFDVRKATVADLDLRKFESMLLADRRVKEVDLWIDGVNDLHVYIDQRNPIVRISPDNGVAYYLDMDGQKVPIRKRAAARVAVVTGAIPEYKDDFRTDKKRTLMDDVFGLAKDLYEDRFLNPLVEQIEVKPNGEFLLASKIGRKKIDFGRYENTEEKYFKLKTFYRDGFPREGWNKFSTLNLKYKDIVVGEYK